MLNRNRLNPIVRFGGKALIFIHQKVNLSKMNSPTEVQKRNVEIKARLADDAAYEKRIDIAKKLTNTDGTLLNQRDIFYNVNSGRLKLRMENDKSMLVQYDREDISGPKLSKFDVYEVVEAERLDRMLSTSIGVIGEVKKQRHLFLHEQTRIHLDKVDGLGTFLEFEVCLHPEQTTDDGTEIANKLMGLFEIKDTDLLTGAYMDELIQLR